MIVRPKTHFGGHYTARLILLSTGLAIAALAGAQSQSFFDVFVETNFVFDSERAALMARNFNLTERRAETGGPTGIFEMGDGSVRAAFIDGKYQMLPDLRAPGKAPTDLDAKAIARKHLDLIGVLIGLLKNETWKIVEVNTWTKQRATEKGEGRRQNIMKSVRFARFLNNMEVMGPNSRLDVDVTTDGVVGMQDFHRYLEKPGIRLPAKSPFQVEEEFKLLAEQYCGKDYKEMGRKLIYWEQGEKFLTPCWLFDVAFKSPDGVESADHLLLPAVQDPPEIIEEHPEFQTQPPIVPDAPLNRRSPLENAIEQEIQPDASFNPVQIGEYIVRADHGCWLDDAKAFWANLNFGRNLTPWHSQVNRRDYWWNYPWLWQDALGILDQSPYYIGRDHYVLIEGHGAPWLITCYKDYGDIIDLKKIKGYGTNQVAGEKTNWIQWQSCDVIPVPGDPFGGGWTTGSPFAVWWTIMKGMRGNLGYHTTMHICNGVSAIHGFRMGLGFPVLSSWLYASDHGVFGHSSGWDYGSAVIVSGREGDTIYNNNQLPNPSSLTMYWIHP